MNTLVSIIPLILLSALIIQLYKSERRKVLAIWKIFGNDSSLIIEQINQSFRSIKSDYTSSSTINGQTVQLQYDGFNNIGILDSQSLKEFCLKVSNVESKDSLHQQLILKNERLRRYQMNSLLKEDFEIQINCMCRMIDFFDSNKSNQRSLVKLYNETNVLELESSTSENKYNKYPELTNQVFTYALKPEAFRLFESYVRSGSLDRIEGNYRFIRDTEQAKVIRLAIQIWEDKLVDQKVFHEYYIRFAYAFMRFIDYQTDAADPFDQFKKIRNS